MVQGIGSVQQYFDTTGKQRILKIEQKKSAAVQRDCDTYMGTKVESTTEEDTFYGMSNAEWEALGKKYDVDHLQPEERQQLLEELQEKGVLTEEEYRTTKFTFIPLPKESLWGSSICIGDDTVCTQGEYPALHFGEQYSWVQKYDAIATYCDALLDKVTPEERDSILAIRDTYLKLGDIFDKMAEAHGKTVETEEA